MRLSRLTELKNFTTQHFDGEARIYSTIHLRVNPHKTRRERLEEQKKAPSFTFWPFIANKEDFWRRQRVLNSGLLPRGLGRKKDRRKRIRALNSGVFIRLNPHKIQNDHPKQAETTFALEFCARSADVCAI
jgi:hypothetical protein